MTQARSFSHLTSLVTPIGLAALIGLGMALTGCRSTEKASINMPSQSPTAAVAYPNPQGIAPTGGQQSLHFPAPAGQGSVFAPQPTPISFTGTAPASPGQPNITAKAAILVDGSGRVLFEKNADARLPTASTQKLLLGLLVAEGGNLSKPITVAEADTWAEPTVMGLRPGEVYLKGDLLRAVLIRRCKDIARTLARDHSGSEAAFVVQVNQKARQIGMTNSYFTNSNGLPSPSGQYSTARDMAKLGMAANRNPIVRDATSTKAYNFRLANGSVKTLYNTNLVLKNFPYCTGGKTGTTNAAGRCLVSTASANGRNVVAVVLGSSSPNVWTESEALLRYGLGM